MQIEATDLAHAWRGSMLSIVGVRDGEWLRTDGREGVVLYGPYMPLDAGSYVATFEVDCGAAAASDRTVVTCDIAQGNEGRRITSIDVTNGGGSGPFEVTLPFSLAEPTDLVQFRAIALAGIPIRVRDHVSVTRSTAKRTP